MRRLFEEVGVKQKSPQVFQDNIGCTEWAAG